MDTVRWHARPTLHRPTLIAAFTGWNDASDAASTAVRTMIEHWDARPLATVDPEDFTDFATTRPHVRLTGGTTREIIWPTVSAWYASLPGSDVIFVLGPEPSLRWRTFTEELVDMANEMGVGMVLTLGALLADVSHTRPVNIIGTATEQDLIDRFELRRSRYEGPTGIVGVLSHAFTAAGLPTMSLWAAVPAYASQLPSPKAAHALIERSCGVIGTPVPADVLDDEIAEYDHRVERLVEQDTDLIGYVRRLEAQSDSDDDFGYDDDQDEDDDEPIGGEAAIDVEESDLLIEEVEQFLRDQGTN